MNRVALLGTTLALSACQMANPAFDQRVGDGSSTADSLDSGDGDGDTTSTLETGESDTTADTSEGICGDGLVDLGEECDDNEVQNGECDATCHIVCSDPFANCNQMPGDGCEANLEADELNCGICGTHCFGGGCELGLCGAFQVADAALAFDVAIDGGKIVYWTDREAGTVSRTEIGQDGVELVAGQLNQPVAIALGDNRVFFTEWGAGQISGWNFDLNNAWILQGQTGAWAVTAGGGELFWGLRDEGVVNRMDQDNQGTPTKFFDGLPPLTGLAHGGDYVAWISGIENGSVGAAWLDPNTEMSTFAFGRGTPLNEVASNGSHIFYTNAGAGTVEKISIEGGEPEVLVDGLITPYGVVVEGDWVYFGDLDTGLVRALQLGAVEPVILAEGQFGVRGVDANGQFLVWARGEPGGGVWALALP